MRIFPRPGRKSAIALGVLVGALVIAAAGAAYATYDYHKEYEGLLLPGTRVAGVDVGGMTEAEAIDAVAAGIRPELDRPISVAWEDESWSVTPRKLGAKDDSEAAVAAAVDASRSASFLDKMQMKLFGDLFDFEREVAITHPRQGVRGFIEGIASSLNQKPRDATVDYSTGWVEVVPERQGRQVAVKRNRAALMTALGTGASEVNLRVRTVEPEAVAKDFRKVLLVRIGENKLYLYEDGEITHSWPVATGLPEYPTPSGIFDITLKRFLPTWVNPSPDTWGKDMPEEIPPGPGNPLGLRALNWSAPAIRFHGTSATYSLGYNASHGCVRLSNEDVIELYDMIEVGTPIVSTVVAPLKPLYAAAPDPTVVQEDEGKKRPSTGPGDQQDQGED